MDFCAWHSSLPHLSGRIIFFFVTSTAFILTRQLTVGKVADTSFNLYIGIKKSGAFQHSSFLHGSRISAAGLIKIKDGQLRQLSPLRYTALFPSQSPDPDRGRKGSKEFKFRTNTFESLSSGHYRPPTSNFRAFIRALQARGVDMSAMTVSKSYMVLLGLEGYTRTKKKLAGVRKGVRNVFVSGGGEGGGGGGGAKETTNDGRVKTKTKTKTTADANAE